MNLFKSSGEKNVFKKLHASQGGCGGGGTGEGKGLKQSRACTGDGKQQYLVKRSRKPREKGGS